MWTRKSGYAGAVFEALVTVETLAPVLECGRPRDGDSRIRGKPLLMYRRMPGG